MDPCLLSCSWGVFWIWAFVVLLSNLLYAAKCAFLCKFSAFRFVWTWVLSLLRFLCFWYMLWFWDSTFLMFLRSLSMWNLASLPPDLNLWDIYLFLYWGFQFFDGSALWYYFGLNMFFFPVKISSFMINVASRSVQLVGWIGFCHGLIKCMQFIFI